MKAPRIITKTTIAIAINITTKSRIEWGYSNLFGSKIMWMKGIETRVAVRSAWKALKSGIPQTLPNKRLLLICMNAITKCIMIPIHISILDQTARFLLPRGGNL